MTLQQKISFRILENTTEVNITENKKGNDYSQEPLDVVEDSFEYWNIVITISVIVVVAIIICLFVIYYIRKRKAKNKKDTNVAANTNLNKTTENSTTNNIKSDNINNTGFNNNITNTEYQFPGGINNNSVSLSKNSRIKIFEN